MRNAFGGSVVLAAIVFVTMQAPSASAQGMGSSWSSGSSDSASSSEPGLLTKSWEVITWGPKQIASGARTVTTGAWNRTTGAWNRTKAALNPWPKQPDMNPTPWNQPTKKEASTWKLWPFGAAEEEKKPETVNEWLRNPRP